jgi:hypothetical protein
MAVPEGYCNASGGLWIMAEVYFPFFAVQGASVIVVGAIDIFFLGSFDFHQNVIRGWTLRAAITPRGGAR